jgi:hypothetical protein
MLTLETLGYSFDETVYFPQMSGSLATCWGETDG